MRISLILLFFVVNPRAAFSREVTLLGGISYASPTETLSGTSYPWTGNASISYGFTYSEELFNPHFEIESGALSLGSEVTASIAGVDTTQTLRAWQIPLLIRFHFDPWISLAVGGYYSIGQGSVDTSTYHSTTRQSYGDASLSSSDSGFVLSLRAKLHFNQNLSFVIDSRYQHGLKNRALTPGDTFNTRSIQVLAGIGDEF